MPLPEMIYRRSIIRVAFGSSLWYIKSEFLCHNGETLPIRPAFAGAFMNRPVCLLDVANILYITINDRRKNPCQSW